MDLLRDHPEQMRRSLGLELRLNLSSQPQAPQLYSDRTVFMSPRYILHINKMPSLFTIRHANMTACVMTSEGLSLSRISLSNVNSKVNSGVQPHMTSDSPTGLFCQPMFLLFQKENGASWELHVTFKVPQQTSDLLKSESKVMAFGA